MNVTPSALSRDKALHLHVPFFLSLASVLTPQSCYLGGLIGKSLENVQVLSQWRNEITRSLGSRKCLSRLWVQNRWVSRCP